MKMKKFLRTHVLFPQYLGFAPYFWLIFMLPAFSVITDIQGMAKYFWLAVIVVYIKIYRDSFMTAKHFSLRVGIQLVIDMIFAFVFNYIFLFVFTSFLIGSFPVSKKVFKRLLWTFYLALGVSLSWILYIVYTGTTKIDIFEIALLVLSPALPVIASRSLGEQQAKRQALREENQRLRLLATERERIAQALHDDLGQSFSLIALKAEVAQKFMEKDLAKTKEQLEQIANESRNDLELVRQIVRDLKNETLIQTLHEASEKLKQAKIVLLVKNETIAMNWEQEVQQIFARSINEAVTNAIRHSQADIFTVIFSEDEHKYQVVIKDNGIGLSLKEKQASFGIIGIKQRIAKASGTSAFEAENGTQITLTIPKKERNWE